MELDYLEIIKYYGKEILDSKNMQKEKEFMQHGNITVFDHSINVAIECLKLVHRYRIPVDQKTLVRGALLHDYFLYDWHEKDKSHKLHGFIHAEKALTNAEKEYELNEIERNMIYCHMFPLNLRIPKYKESIILTIADKIIATKETLEPYKKLIKVNEKYI